MSLCRSAVMHWLQDHDQDLQMHCLCAGVLVECEFCLDSVVSQLEEGKEPLDEGERGRARWQSSGGRRVKCDRSPNNRAERSQLKEGSG